MTRAEGITIRPFSTRSDFEACVRLQQETWGENFSERVPVAILQTVQRLGGVASGAFDAAGNLVGFIFGISGWRQRAPIHWSDMMAVSPVARDRGIGERLKWHQREELLARDIAIVEWTFEPLEARNAHLNINRLGVRVVRYVRDYYGDSDATLHVGLGTDRLVVEWHLRDVEVEARACGDRIESVPVDPDDMPLVNTVRTVDGVAATAAVRSDLDDPCIRIAIPAAIQELRAAHPDIAADWRAATRSAFEMYLPRYDVTGVARYGRWSAYVLTKIRG